jgi:hypothetical protein
MTAAPKTFFEELQQLKRRYEDLQPALASGPLSERSARAFLARRR